MSTKSQARKRAKTSQREDEIQHLLKNANKSRQSLARDLGIETGSLCAAVCNLKRNGVIRVLSVERCEETGCLQEILTLVPLEERIAPPEPVQPPKPLRLVTSPKEEVQKVIRLNFKAQSQLNEILKYLNELSSKAAK